MSRVPLFLVTLLVAATLCAQDVPGFRTARWGDDRQAIQSKFPQAKPINGKLEDGLFIQDAVVGTPSNFEFHFDETGLFQVTSLLMDFTTEHEWSLKCEEIAGELAKKYGVAAQDQVRQKMIGREREAIWSGQSGSLTLNCDAPQMISIVYRRTPNDTDSGL